MEYERLSPRKAIQSWLCQTKTPLHHEAQTLEAARTFSPSRVRCQRTEDVGEARGKRPAVAASQDTNLAKRLGLHAPFSTLPEDLNVASIGTAHPRKKGRLRASSDSFIDEIPPQISHPEGKELFPSRLRVGSDDPSANYPTSASPKKYQRRKRHKTREDRYDLKVPGGRKRERENHQVIQMQLGKSRCRRKQRGGNAVTYDYTAANVAQERLSVSVHRPFGSIYKSYLCVLF